MLQRITLFIITSLFCTSLFTQPTGIYVLDNDQGKYRDQNIRNYSFVDGFVWRTSWSNFETSLGVYDYKSLDHIIQHLDSINKKLTILFGTSSIEPSYISLQSGVTTYSYVDPVSKVISTRPVPYDGYLLQRFRLFMNSFANHQIFSQSTGTMVALKDHPVLTNITTNIPGWGAIVNLNGQNNGLQTILPNYSRKKLVDSLLVSMKIQTDNFPNKNVFIPFYKNTNDNNTSPPLVTAIRDQLLSNFNDIQNPKISFWQENLAGSTDTTTKIFTGSPTITDASPLYQLNDSAYTMFQMLQGWTTPFIDSTKTANSTPFDAMCYAFNAFQSSYYEVHVSDIDNPSYQQAFSNWNILSCDTSLSINESTIENKLKIYPNPATNVISISGINTGQKATVSIFNSDGIKLLSTENYQNIDVTNFSNGIYFIRVNQNGERISFSFIKQ